MAALHSLHAPARHAAQFRRAAVHRPSRARAVTCMATLKRDGFGAALGSAAFACGLTLALVSSPASANVIADEAFEREQAAKTQTAQIEYLLQQQDIVKKAALLAQRKELETKVGVVESQLQQKLTEQRASAFAAEKQGNKGAAEAYRAQEAQLEEKAALVRKTAAQIEGKLDRVEMLQRAKAIAEKQALAGALAEEFSDVNNVLDKYLEVR